MSLLSMSGVTKKFGDIHAVNDLSFSVAPGEIFGFLGGNGAGKTTSLRMILDIIRPTAGTIEVLGQKPGRAISNRLGFLPEERGLYKNMSAIDTIVYFGRLKGMSTSDARARGMALLERFELADRAKTQISEMSKGMAQKVQLATSIVNSPELLMLDEPFSGLDPVNQQLLESEIVRASQGGAAVIFSTHVMQHAERLCDRLLILKKGSKRFEGTVSEARDSMPPRISIVAASDLGRHETIAASRQTGTSDNGWPIWDIELKPGASGADLLESLSSRGVALRGYHAEQASLHDVFVHLVGEEEASQ